MMTVKGGTNTKESNRKRSETLKERYRNQIHFNKGRRSPKKGVPRTIETRLKISSTSRISTKLKRGKDCHSYKDGKLDERRDQRFSREGKRWRMDVFLRDKFTCQNCGDDKGGNLIAHHIKSFADYPDSRFDLDNGLTVCDKCHKEIHYGNN